jgi:aryl-alcohol dehydrogenase-like predicted oxidoreductase
VQERKIPRERLVVITKGGCHGQEKLWSANISEASIRSDIQGSCEVLGTDHVDVFMLHRDDPKIHVATIVDMMDTFQREGLVTVWGVSNWALPRLQAALAYAKETGKSVPVCDSLQFSLAQPTRSVWPDTQYMSADAREWYAATGTAVLAWECLAKGFMAGKVRGKPPPRRCSPLFFFFCLLCEKTLSAGRPPHPTTTTTPPPPPTPPPLLTFFASLAS